MQKLLFVGGKQNISLFKVQRVWDQQKGFSLALRIPEMRGSCNIKALWSISLIVWALLCKKLWWGIQGLGLSKTKNLQMVSVCVSFLFPNSYPNDKIFYRQYIILAFDLSESNLKSSASGRLSWCFLNSWCSWGERRMYSKVDWIWVYWVGRTLEDWIKTTDYGGRSVWEPFLTPKRRPKLEGSKVDLGLLESWWEIGPSVVHYPNIRPKGQVKFLKASQPCGLPVSLPVLEESERRLLGWWKGQLSTAMNQNLALFLW